MTTKSVSMPEVRRNCFGRRRPVADSIVDIDTRLIRALPECLYLHDYVRPNTKHRGVSTPVVPRRRARIDYVGSAAAVAHGHAIHQLEHHGQLRMMPGESGVAAHTHTLRSRRIAGRRGRPTWISIVMVLSANVAETLSGSPSSNTRALVFS